MQVAVRKLLCKHGDEVGSISVTGHSLGGALASLCAFDIANSCINRQVTSGVLIGWTNMCGGMLASRMCILVYNPLGLQRECGEERWIELGPSLACHFSLRIVPRQSSVWEPYHIGGMCASCDNGVPWQGDSPHGAEVPVTAYTFEAPRMGKCPSGSHEVYAILLTQSHMEWMQLGSEARCHMTAVWMALRRQRGLRGMLRRA